MSATVLANHLISERDPRSAFRLVGTSKAWCDVIDRAPRIATTDVTTCLQGESGTGKEVIARFIHSSSPRRDGPFIAINCAALPDQLIESELFGFERGAFTSAQQSKPGQIELARGGVLFLDEITELTASAQAKLLRFLQEREFQRLGGTRIVSGATIQADDLSLEPRAVLRHDNTADLTSVERSMIERVMRDVDGNISKAARTLGISRTQLYVRPRKHGFSQAI